MGFHHFYDKFADRRLGAIQSAPLSIDDRLALVKQHGSGSVAFSTAVQDGLSYFGDQNGYIAFAVKSGYAFALSEPVAPDDAKHQLIRDFIAAAKSPTFVQISQETAAFLASLDYPVEPLGIETTIPLSEKLFSGSSNQSIRYSASWLRRNGYVIEDTQSGESDISELSKSWRAGRTVRREMRFANRPFSEQLLPEMRRFILRDPQGTLLAFIDFDPLYVDGKKIGYSTALKRRAPDATNHAEIGLTMQAATLFKEEGLSALNLGLSPLAPTTEHDFSGRKNWRKAMDFCFQSPLINRKFFNVKGHADFKRRFHGQETNSYMAIGSGSLTEAIALLRLLKLI